MASVLARQVRRAAEELAAAWPESTPSGLAYRLDIEIIEAPSPPLAQPGLRSEYRANPPRIVLYTRTIGTAFARRQDSCEGPSSLAEFKELHVAHELFHHLEAQGRFCSLPREESERAAQAFAWYLCGLDAEGREAGGAEPFSGEPST